MLERAALILVVSVTTVAAQTPAPTPLGPQAYHDYQVDKPVVPSTKNRAPEYPKDLRKASIEGQVLATFVVDSTGRVLMPTFTVVRSDNDAFTKAVREAVPKLRFAPAEIKGKRVAQIVRMPFQFSLAVPDTGYVTRR